MAQNNVGRWLMLTLYQRLIFGYVLLLALLLAVGLHDSLSLHQAAALDQQGVPTATAMAVRAALARQATTIATVCTLSGVAITIGFLISIIRPIRRTAAAARRIGQGELQQRIEWRTRDDLGTIATELNRMTVRLRDLRETEYGRKQMDQQLSDAVVQSIFEPVIVTDAKGQVLKLNQAASEVLGEAAGDRMALTNTPGGERILRAVRDAVSMRQSVASEDEAAMLPMKLGEGQRSYRLRTTPMRDLDGKLLGAVSVLEDITEMQDIDRFKTRFLSVASRRLRQPLEQLRLSLYTLTSGFAGELRPLQADVLHGAEEDAERLNDLMSDLIEVSEIDTGRRELRMDKFRPIDILGDACSRARDEVRAKNIDVQIQAFADLAHVNGDRRALRSIMDNLMSNAVRYTPENGTILLQAKEQKDIVQFSVRDSGRGIEAERLPNIFGRFSAAHDQGTGLGLALVRRLVELLGGQISVESRLGHGTTFSFTLPVATAVPTRHPIEIG
jgi:signal transduction histidine kinase/HAMP domain-containing protein